MKATLPILLLLPLSISANAAEPPVDLGPGNAVGSGINYASAAVTFPDGTLESYFRRAAEGAVSIFRARSTDNGRTWSEAEPLVALSVEPWGGPMPLLDRDGELHFVIPRVRGEGRRPAVDRFIDLYHLRSTGGRTGWTEPKRVYEGYCGALQGVFQLKNGRILAPFADWLPSVPTRPPTGPSETTALYSDDGGATWRRSPARLTAPCFDGYNGANYGACEPTLIELKDGKLWMLLRTQTGSLYESFSDDGVDWTEARPSRFPSSNSPAFPIRLGDGRMVLFWNHCVMPPRAGKDGVYGGRDALHGAISGDDGKSWRGFREIYRDPNRNGTPPATGDRGTAYPHATLTADGKILLVSGQGESLRRRFIVDPDWLLETRAEAPMGDFEAWHVFKGFGPAKRFWRDRKAGPEWVNLPDLAEKPALRLRRPDELPGDGATWNFPAGRAGRLTLRVRVEPGCGGGSVCLTDRFYDPCDAAGEADAPFRFDFDARSPAVAAGVWREWGVTWRADGGGEVAIDGVVAASLKARRDFPNGLSYLRLRSTAAEIDPAGFTVAAVSVEIEP